MTKPSKVPIGNCTVHPEGDPLMVCGKPAYEKFGRKPFISYACPEHIEGMKKRIREMFTII